MGVVKEIFLTYKRTGILPAPHYKFVDKTLTSIIFLSDIPTTHELVLLGVLFALLFVSSLILLALYCTITAKNNDGCNCNCILSFCCYWCLLCCGRGREYDNVNENKPDGQQE